MTTTEPIAVTFADLGLPPALVAALESAGIGAPFPIQALTIPDGIAGRDVCGKAKTGSGKTLAFGLPLLARVAQGRAPAAPRPRPRAHPGARPPGLRGARAARARRVDRRVVAVYGGARMDQQIAQLRDRRRPGRRHAGPADRPRRPGRCVARATSSIVVLDEADRMADMGFLPQVEWLLRHMTGEHQTLLFSATLDGAIDHLVRSLPARPRPPRGHLPHDHRRGDDAPLPARSTRWTR